MNLKETLRVIPDFPKKGIQFIDITTLLKDKEAFAGTIDKMVELWQGQEIDVIAGPEARGFLLGAPMAYKMGAGVVPVRKPGKLPGDILKGEYELEYGKDALEIHRDAITPGQKVLIVDDLIATGGTLLTTAKLIEELCGEVVGITALVELTFLQGRETLKGYRIESLVKY